MSERLPFVLSLHSGQLYGTEKASLAMASFFSDTFDPIIFVPPGPAVSEAQKRGFRVVETTSNRTFGMQLRALLARNQPIAFFSTRTSHSLIFVALNNLYRRRAAHVHVVHGTKSADPRGYSSRRMLNHLPVFIVAVSEFVRHQLISHGVRNQQVKVIENSLPAEYVAAAPRRERFSQAGIRRVAVVSRLDPEKRIDLLLTCLEARPELRSIAFHIYGGGSEHERLQERAAEHQVNVIFEGFRSDVPRELTKADLLLHLCPVESFGLVMLEAMLAGVPVLAPNGGGAGCVVEDGVSGLLFEPDDATSLGARLLDLRTTKPERLNALVRGGDTALANRFSEQDRLDEYRSLVASSLKRNLG